MAKTGQAEAVHVAGGVSSAETIREALRSQGCQERVIALAGAVNVGVIEPPDPDGRQR